MESHHFVLLGTSFFTSPVRGCWKVRTHADGIPQNLTGRHDPTKKALITSSASQYSDCINGWQYILYIANAQTLYHGFINR